MLSILAHAVVLVAFLASTFYLRGNASYGSGRWDGLTAVLCTIAVVLRLSKKASGMSYMNHREGESTVRHVQSDPTVTFQLEVHESSC